MSDDDSKSKQVMVVTGDLFSIHFDFEEISFHNTVFSTNGIINDVDDGIIDVETFSMKDILWYKQVLIWKTEKNM